MSQQSEKAIENANKMLLNVSHFVELYSLNPSNTVPLKGLIYQRSMCEILWRMK